MTSGANGEWVRQGTPRDDNADWNEEQSEYGTAVSPTEWDDYSSEQSVPVAAPRTQVPEGAPTAASSGSPDSSSEREPETVPGQEPDSEEEYRSEETGGDTEDEPAGDADESGVDPVHVDAPEQRGSTAVTPEEIASVVHDAPDDEQVTETSRPRPIVPDASMAAVGTAEPGDVDATPEAVDHSDAPDEVEAPDEGVAMDEADAGAEMPDEDEERHVEAAEYLAVDPVPVALDAPEDEFAVDEANEETRVRGIPAQPAEDDDDEMEATQAVPVTVVAAEPETTGNVPDGLYRADGAEPTALIGGDTYPDVDVEEERLQARLDAERQAREQRLGAVATSSENASREDAGPPRITTDRFFPSFALFVLRLVTASILGLTSWQILGSGVDATANFLGGYPLIPEPRLVAWILGFTLGALALLLVIGLLQRLVGFLLLVIAVATLTFIRWGSFSIFDADTAGFIGDQDLLLAAVGLVLLGMGGGRWGIDGAFRAARAASKAEREG